MTQWSRYWKQPCTDGIGGCGCTPSSTLPMLTGSPCTNSRQPCRPARRWPRGYNGCRGPVLAVIRATRAVGWELISAVSIRTEDGQLWSLRDGSPAMRKHLYRERWVAIQAMQALGHRFNKCAGHPGEAQALIERGIAPLPLKRAFLSKGNQGLNHGERGASSSSYRGPPGISQGNHATFVGQRIAPTTGCGTALIPTHAPSGRPS